MKSTERWPEEWSEVLLLTRNDDWETDVDKYNRVRELMPRFGGKLLPKVPEALEDKRFRIIVIVEPSGVRKEFERMTDASSYLNYDIGNLRKMINKGEVPKKGKLRGYFIYEKVSKKPLDRGLLEDEVN